MKKLILEKYIKFAKDLDRHPSLSDLGEIGITRAQIRHHFGSITKLKAKSKLKFEVKEIEEEKGPTKKITYNVPKLEGFHVHTMSMEKITANGIR